MGNSVCCGGSKPKNIEKKVDSNKDGNADHAFTLEKAGIKGISVTDLQNKDFVNGIQNKSNNCYISSAVHCLSQTKELTEYLFTENFDLADTKSAKDAIVLKEYIKLLTLLWKSKEKSGVSCKEFKEAICLTNKHVAPFNPVRR